jgi:hypothetical protein
MIAAVTAGGRRIPVLNPGSLLCNYDGLDVARGEVHLWALSLATDANTITRCRQILSPEEQGRADRFVYDKDHNEFILAHGLLGDVPDVDTDINKMLTIY